MLTRRQFLGAAAAGAALATFPAVRIGRATQTPLRNLVFLMQENRSFDHYFGLYPGAAGFPDCAPVEHAATLCLDAPPHDLKAAATEARAAGDPSQGFRQTAGGTALSFYTGRDLPYYWALADRFTLCDHYFCAALGGTAINRVFSIAASAGGIRDNDSLPSAALPPATIADRLDEARIDWRCYIANPPDAGAYNPFGYFPDRRADPRAARPYSEFLAAAAAGRLPAVSWVVAEDPLTEHGPDDISWGERFVALTVNSLAAGPQWARSALVLSYDENGGFYDHLAPPRVDGLGLGFRVPAIVVSPFSKAGHVSSSIYEHCSSLALVERTFGLRPLADRDAAADPFEDVFDFVHSEPGFIDYPERRLDSCGAAPVGWAGQLLSLPVPRSGSAGRVPAARALCDSRPLPDLATGLAAGAAIAAVAAAGSRARRPS